jgi:hypothetical protein
VSINLLFLDPKIAYNPIDDQDSLWTTNAGISQHLLDSETLEQIEYFRHPAPVKSTLAPEFVVQWVMGKSSLHVAFRKASQG